MMNRSEMIQRTSDALRAGQVVAFPTEAVYCVGADIQNRNAVTRIFELKGRPKSDPLIVHIADAGDVGVLADRVPAKAGTLMDRFWPGALTIVLPRKSACNDVACTKGVALQLSSNPIACELVRRAGRPIAAASANICGHVGPTCIGHVKADLGDALTTFIDDGPCTIGIETTIVSFMDEEPVMLRPGAVPREQIEAAIGPLPIAEKEPNASNFPGLSDHQYEFGAVVLFEDQVEHLSRDLRTGLVCYQPAAHADEYDAVEVLSQKGCLEEAAHNLFAAIRRLDALDLDLIVVQRVPDTGLGIAINDRLARACSSSS